MTKLVAENADGRRGIASSVRLQLWFDDKVVNHDTPVGNNRLQAARRQTIAMRPNDIRPTTVLLTAPRMNYIHHGHLAFAQLVVRCELVTRRNGGQHGLPDKLGRRDAR